MYCIYRSIGKLKRSLVLSFGVLQSQAPRPYVSSLAFQSAAQLGVDNATKVKGPTGASSLGLDLWLQLGRVGTGREAKQCRNTHQLDRELENLNVTALRSMLRMLPVIYWWSIS